jgi:hypothetical protein
MSPNRDDYKTRKEYRWAKKLESRQASKDIITSLPPLKTSVCIGVITWFAVVLVGVAALPSNAGGAAGGAVVAGATLAAIVFPKSRAGRSWARAWDALNKRRAHAPLSMWPDF